MTGKVLRGDGMECAMNLCGSLWNTVGGISKWNAGGRGKQIIHYIRIIINDG